MDLAIIIPPMIFSLVFMSVLYVMKALMKKEFTLTDSEMLKCTAILFIIASIAVYVDHSSKPATQEDSAKYWYNDARPFKVLQQYQEGNKLYLTIENADSAEHSLETITISGIDATAALKIGRDAPFLSIPIKKLPNGSVDAKNISNQVLSALNVQASSGRSSYSLNFSPLEMEKYKDLPENKEFAIKDVICCAWHDGVLEPYDLETPFNAYVKDGKLEVYQNGKFAFNQGIKYTILLDWNCTRKIRGQYYEYNISLGFDGDKKQTGAVPLIGICHD